MPYDNRYPKEIVPTEDPEDLQLLPPTYLEDGLYCGHDGFQVILFTLEGMKVAITPDAVRLVQEYMKRIVPHYANERIRLAEKMKKERDA